MLAPAPRARDFWSVRSWGLRPRLYAGARSAGSRFWSPAILGLTPQALCWRPLRGLAFFVTRSWGLRPRLYAVARSAGSLFLWRDPGAYAPGFMLSPAPRARFFCGAI